MHIVFIATGYFVKIIKITFVTIALQNVTVWGWNLPHNSAADP